MTKLNRPGMTLKQFARTQFWRALAAYRQALRSGEGIVEASVAIHVARGTDGVPKAWDRYVRHVFEKGG